MIPQKCLAIVTCVASILIATFAFVEDIAVPVTYTDVLVDVMKKAQPDELRNEIRAALVSRDGTRWWKYIFLGGIASLASIWQLKLIGLQLNSERQKPLTEGQKPG